MALLYPGLLLIGGGCYMLLELLWRKRTHWSMGVMGGVVFLLLYLVFTRIGPERLLLKGVVGAAIITALEFLGGAVINMRLKWNVWDYSGLPANLYGQVCLLYSGLWFLLSMFVALFVQAIAQVFSYSGL